jgi:protein SCO1/2
MKNKLRGKIILALLLIVPIIWVLLWKSGKHHYSTLPIYGSVEMTGDTIPFVITEFNFINQYGKEISDKDFENKIYVANFFFATCPDVCPEMNNNLTVVYDKFKNHDNVMILSHTVHPEHDSVAVLAEYAIKLGVTDDKWQFVTGRKTALYRMAEYEYRITATKGSGPKDFIHSEMLVLIDTDKHIRGYYNGRDFKDIQKLNDGIKVLLKEEREKKIKRTK